MGPRSSRSWAISLFLLLAVGPAPLAAQDLRAQRNGTRAIECGNEGVALYERGKWSEALERFRQAESLYHSAVFVLYAARSLRNAGRLLEARESFRRLVSETLEPSASELWKRAQAEGRAELAALEAHIPSVVISVTGGSPSARISVDDRQVVPGASIELDPGPHRVFVTDHGRSGGQTFNLAPGARGERIVVELPRAKTTALPPTARDLGSDGKGGIYLPGLVVAAVGGAAIAAGAVIGVIALNEKSEARAGLPGSCDGTTCPRSRQGEIEDRIARARNLGTIADVFLIGGAAATAVGVGLLIFNPGHDDNVRAGVSDRGGFVRVRF